MHDGWNELNPGGIFFPDTGSPGARKKNLLNLLNSVAISLAVAHTIEHLISFTNKLS
jgi:hypothetical protein